ncbi:hypothetical protein, partial [Listeria monocytogenes]|uniref:hypothetical protein n=1 Tax=Listeria monocytogenes TaxID=1639 RepID=UPI0011EA5F01
MSSRSYCYTCHALAPIHLTLPTGCVYNICGLEIGSSTGKTHYQGYVELDRGRDVKWYKKNICSSCHVEPRHGTQQQAITYCQKDGK